MVAAIVAGAVYSYQKVGFGRKPPCCFRWHLEAEDLAAALHREVAEEKKGVAYAPVADPAIHPLEKGNAKKPSNARRR